MYSKVLGNEVRVCFTRLCVESLETRNEQTNEYIIYYVFIYPIRSFVRSSFSPPPAQGLLLNPPFLVPGVPD